MSIDLDVFPTTSKTLYWKDIRVRLEILLGNLAPRLVGEQPKLRHLGSDLIVQEDEALFYPNHYIFDLAIPNGLGLGIESNKDILIDERDYLEGYGRNLAPETIQQLVEVWKAVGYSFTLTVPAVRSSEDDLLFVCVATAFADACEGYVISMGDYGYIEEVSGLGVGVYTAEEFRRVIPHFARRL